VVFSPAGGTLAATQNDWSGVTVFSAGSSGALSVLSGSPFATGAPPTDVAFSASGLLATTTIDSAVEVLAPLSTSSATNWVGAYGSAGYDLGAWNGESDISDMPGAGLSLAQGSRYVWARCSTWCPAKAPTSTTTAITAGTEAARRRPRSGPTLASWPERTRATCEPCGG
jgi:hypothetical protein